MSKTKNRREIQAQKKRNKRAREQYIEEMSERAFKSSNVLGKDISKNIKKILTQNIELRNIPYNTFYHTLLKNKNIAQEIDFFDFALKISKLKGDKMLENPDTFKTLVEIVKLKRLWIRDISKWKKKSHNVHNQL